MPAGEFRIRADGEASAELLWELIDFEAQAVASGTMLRGSVVDSAALWGVLHRLHRAGLTLRSIERLVPPAYQSPEEYSPARATDPAGNQLARIEVEGHAGRAIAGSVDCVGLYESPPSTTLLVRIAGEDELFRLLTVLENLALDVREIRFD